MKRIYIELKGAAHLMLHNGQLSDPLNEYAKALREVAKRRNKTDDDHELVARTEWEGGLYLDSDDDVCIPMDNLLALGNAGARKSKLGKQFSAGVFGSEASHKLMHGGPKGVEALYQHNDGEFVDRRPARVGTAFVIRTRPVFREWGILFDVLCDETVIDTSDVENAYREAGRVVGCLEMRPRYGRYSLEAFEVSDV